MIATPITAAELARCRSSPGPLGPAFTQAAIVSGQHAATINVGDIRAGDVFLVGRASATNRFKNPVYRYQRLLFDADTAQWTHCAVIDENLTVWDAMPSADVRSRPLRELLREAHRLRLVRPAVAPDPTLLRTSLLQFSNHSYRVLDIATLGRLGARLARAGTWANPVTDDRTVMCSLFVSNVLRRSTKHGYFRRLPVVIPADFAADRDFADVPLHWCHAEP